MPVADVNKLVDIFDCLQRATSRGEKESLLFRAETCVANEMTSSELREFFTSDQAHLANLFALDIWTKSLDEVNGIVEFIQPYGILERIFGCFVSLADLLDSFAAQIVQLLEQLVDEKVKHISVQHITKLTKRLVSDVSAYELADVERVEARVEANLRALMPHIVGQLTHTAVSYAQCVGELWCAASVELNKLSSLVAQRRERVHVFSCTLFENNEPLVEQIAQIASTMGSVMAMRVLDMLTSVALVSGEHLKSICESKFHYAEMLGAYLSRSTDVLAKLNGVEMCSRLVRTEHGYAFLKQRAHLGHLLQVLVASDDNEQADSVTRHLLAPSIVALFLHVAHERIGDVHADYSAFIVYIFAHALDESRVLEAPVDVLTALECLAHLFTSNHCKRFLLAHYANDMQRLLADRLVHIVQYTINEAIKTAALKCVAELTAADTELLDSQQQHTEKLAESAWLSDEWLEQAKRCYATLTSHVTHEKLFDVVLRAAKQPGAAMRIAAHGCLKALAQSRWGLVLLFTPNKHNSFEAFFTGYLLNRSTEPDKEGLESKFELVKLVLASFRLHADLGYMIGEDGTNLLVRYVRDGAFYTRSQANVAFESS